MQIKTITWDQRFQTKSIDAAAAYDELGKIKKKNKGSLTPATVVEASKPKKAVLHPAFTWDDIVAAQKYREDEARRVMQCLRVEYVTPTGDATPPVRAMQVEYKNPANSGGANYATTHEVLSSRSSRNQLLLDALRELAAFRQKYAALSELSHLIPILDKEIETLRDAVASE